MKINDVNRGVTKFKKRKRFGRGPGSGQGKTAGRGHKGQGARAGWSAPVTFQGGTMPVIRRIPKRGFTNAWALKITSVNVGDLEKAFEAGAEVTPDLLKGTSLLGSAWDQIKILGDGELTKKLTVSAHRFSKSAIEKIEKAGGKAVVLPGRTAVEEKKKAAREANKTTAKAKKK